jgi:hypothetical protein
VIAVAQHVDPVLYASPVQGVSPGASRLAAALRDGLVAAVAAVAANLPDHRGKWFTGA